jgi:hypothetical protein
MKYDLPFFMLAGEAIVIKELQRVCQVLKKGKVGGGKTGYYFPYTFPILSSVSRGT